MPTQSATRKTKAAGIARSGGFHTYDLQRAAREDRLRSVLLLTDVPRQLPGDERADRLGWMERLAKVMESRNSRL